MPARKKMPVAPVIKPPALLVTLAVLTRTPSRAVPVIVPELTTVVVAPVFVLTPSRPPLMVPKLVTDVAPVARTASAFVPVARIEPPALLTSVKVPFETTPIASKMPPVSSAEMLPLFVTFTDVKPKTPNDPLFVPPVTVIVPALLSVTALL